MADCVVYVMKNKLSWKDQLNLDKAVKTTVAIERYMKNAIELQGQRDQQQVNNVHIKSFTP